MWAALRAQPNVRRGHNVAIYHNGRTMTVGVQIDAAAFQPRAGVTLSATPAGRAATATHIGPYAEMRRTNDAIIAWCREAGLQLSGPSWEVYGDWEEDESNARTDVYYLLR
ncbi:MAG TPA: GyrI-like domain-containing protein [Dehalococcoidia bacterium]|nr:GyrI-like domain-containing protein [Dehalococcoidia bacterium]